MSNTTSKLPENLPQCECFQTDVEFSWSRCAVVGSCTTVLCGAFHQLVVQEEICSRAMPYLMETVIISILAYTAKSQGPALEYGSEDIEREAERLLTGLEARVLARMRESYAAGRALGLTEENVRAMRAAAGETQQ